MEYKKGTITKKKELVLRIMGKKIPDLMDILF